VIAKSTLDMKTSVSDEAPALRFVGDRRAMTKTAAEKAVELAEVLASGQAVEKTDEGVFFSALQTCAYRAMRRGGRPAAVPSERTEWVERWRLLREHLVEKNLGLVYAMMSRFRAGEVDWEDLRSEALYALMRAVEGFNPWVGFKFSTYACNAIARSLIHVARKADRYRSRFPVECDEWQERPAQVDDRSALYADRLTLALKENLGELTEREALILGWRFPLDGGSALTLGEVGSAIGLSKERVRQIQKSALGKLRKVIEADPVLQ
jgi:RNA polymerase sigma factor (sigma-70 family)